MKRRSKRFKYINYQSIYYSIILLIWIVLNIMNGIDDFNNETQLGITHSTLFFIIISILLIRILIQNTFSWMLSILLFGSAYFYIFYIVFYYIFNDKTGSGLNLSFDILLRSSLFLIIFSIPFWLAIKFKPIKK